MISLLKQGQVSIQNNFIHTEKAFEDNGEKCHSKLGHPCEYFENFKGYSKTMTELKNDDLFKKLPKEISNREVTGGTNKIIQELK